MHKLNLFSFAILLQLISLASFAQPVSQDSVDKLLVLSGLDSQIKDAAAGADLMLSQTPLTSSNSPKLKEFMASITDANNILEATSKSLKEDLTEDQAKKVIAWYEGDFGNRIARAEELGSTPEAMQNAITNAQSLLSASDRVEQIDKLIGRMDAISESIEVQKTITSAIFAGMSTMQAPGTPVNMSQIEKMVDAQMAGMASQMEQQTRVIMLNTYNDFSIQELEEYYKVLGRSEMKAFNDASVKGTLIVISESVNKLVSQEQSVN